MSSKLISALESLENTAQLSTRNIDSLTLGINSVLTRGADSFHSKLSDFNNDNFDPAEAQRAVELLLKVTQKEMVSLWFDHHPKWFKWIELLVSDQELIDHLQHHELTQLFWKEITHGQRRKRILSNLIKTYLNYYHDLSPYTEWANLLTTAIQHFLHTTVHKSLFQEVLQRQPEFLNHTHGDQNFAQWAVTRFDSPDILQSQYQLSSTILYGQFFSEFFLLFLEKLSKQIIKQQHSPEQIEFLWDQLEHHTNSNCRIMSAVGLAHYFMKLPLDQLKPKGLLRLIGIKDPHQKQLWLGDKLLSEERQDIFRKARNTVRKLLNQITFQDFLHVSNFDTARKKFWNDYIPHMHKVTFYMSREDKTKLERQGFEFYSQSTKLFTSQAGGIATLCMEYKDWVIFEIGAINNACYIYHKNSREYATINKRVFKTEQDVKISGISQRYINKQIAVYHSGNWQYKLATVLRYHLEMKT